MNDIGGPPEMYAGEPEQDVWQRRVDQLQVEVYSRRNILGKVKHYWRCRHVNSEIVCDSSQGYVNRAHRDKMADFLFPDLPEPVDLDQK